MKTSTSLYTTQFSSLAKVAALVLVALTGFSTTAAAQATYKADQILTAPVSHEGIANFLTAPAASNARMAGANDIESPLFGGIQGPDSVCSFTEPVTYSVAVTTDANGNPLQFYWFVPQDWTVVSGQNTHSVTVIPGSLSGQVAVFAVGYCICSYSCKAVISEDCDNVNPLPVELVSFNAARAQSAVLLDWSTASEKNNEAFVIERSNDGRTFTAVGKVAGNGTTTRTIAYSFTDKTAVNSVSYYRLKQVDTDGKFEYSPVRSVSRSAVTANEPAKVYPNPTAGMLKVELPTGTAANATVTIVSVTGQTVFTGTAGSLTNANSQIDMGRFNAGMYILNINSDNNNQSLRITKL